MDLLDYDEFSEMTRRAADAAKKLAMSATALARIGTFARKNDFRG
jgi:hypothetical protein